MSDALRDAPDERPCAIIVGDRSIATTIGELRRLLGAPHDQVVSTTDAARIWPAYSETTWRKWASEGEIPGAWQDAEGGPWRLPLASCRSFVLDRQSRGTRRGRTGPRGPWKRAS